MQKLAFILVLAVTLTFLLETRSTAGVTNRIMDDIIQKIEEKYIQLRESSPFIKAKGKTVAQSIRFIQPEDQVIDDYSNLRQIALIRHGEPDMVKTGKFNSFEASEYVKCYDSVCIIVPEKPFFTIEENEEVQVFSSPINRALTTAHYLVGTEKDICISRDFREFETNINIYNSKKRLPIKFWTTTARLKWMMGMGKQDGIESFSDAKKRAKKAAQTLADASEDNPKVLLTAHGFVNRYIKKNLEKMGWKIVEDTGNDYFGTTILVKIDDKRN